MVMVDVGVVCRSEQRLRTVSIGALLPGSNARLLFGSSVQVRLVSGEVRVQRQSCSAADAGTRMPGTNRARAGGAGGGVGGWLNVSVIVGGAGVPHCTALGLERWK